MEPCMYLSALGFKGIWFSPGKEQTEQPKIYMKYIIEHSFLKYLILDLLKTSVTFVTGGSFKIINLTELNARSPRADFVVYDEEAQAERAAYNAAVSILSVSSLGLIFHISTPVKGSLFEENYDRLRRREYKLGIKCVFSRTWEDVSYLERKRAWYEEQESILPGWYFRQEHCASFELPSGAVFQNVIYRDIPSWIQAYDEGPLVSGLDWNPVAGHWVVGGHWLPNDEAYVVQHAVNLGVGYTHQLNNEQYPSTAKIYQRIKKFTNHGNRLCVEDGGINIAFCDWLRVLRANDSGLRNDFCMYEEWDSANVNKTNAVLELQSVRMYIDEDLFPELAKQVSDAHWEPEAEKPQLAKDAADSPHALDGLLHAVSKGLRRDVILGREDW